MDISRRTFVKGAATCAVLAAGVASGCGSSFGKANRVLIGNIYTADEANRYAEALAIKGDAIVYVGSVQGVQEFIGEDTIVETFADEQLITPALVDGHTHVNQLMMAQFNVMCDLEPESSKESILQQITEFVNAHPELDYYLIKGWDAQAFISEPYKIPTWHLLEGITDKPIKCMSSDGHTYWVNKPLMDKAGITKDTPNPAGGDIAKDPQTGEPLGQFTDTAEYLIDKVEPEKPKEAYYKGIQAADELCLSQGYATRFQALDNEQYDPYKHPSITYAEQLDASDKLRCYQQASFIVQNSEDAWDQVDEAIKLRDRTKGGNFEVTNVKIFTDGIIENAGAYLIEPYSYYEEPWYGTPRWEGEEAVQRMGEVIAKANFNDMPCHFHCMGDRAVSDVLDAIEYAAKKVGKDRVRKCRNAIAHLALVDEKDFARFADLNVTAVLNPWCAKDPKYYTVQQALLGEERAWNQYPMQSFIKAGVHVAFGTDLGASFTYESVECFHVLATRTYNNDDPNSLLNPDEKLTREQTLDAMTIGGAYEMHREDVFGSLTEGKEASVCVWSKDLLTIPDTEIMSTQLVNCMFRGTWNLEEA